MAGGFDAVATGLLGSINQQADNARKEQQRGQEEQYSSFLEASKEYDAAKAKNSDQQTKIDTMAKLIAGHFGRTVADPDYATARDAVEMGYTNAEHLPYVFDAAQHTYADFQQNPDKWNTPAANNNNPVDSNPSQTQIIRRSGDQRPLSDIENIRTHTLNKPYQGLPGGQWGDPNTINNKTIYDRTAAEAKAKSDVENQAVASDWGTPANNSAAPVEATNQAPSPPQMSNAEGSPISVPASQLQPPPSVSTGGTGGMHIDAQAPTPQEQPGILSNAQPSIAPPAVNSPTPQIQGQQQPAQPQLQGKPALNEEFLNNLPPSKQVQVKGVADGSMDISDIVKSRGIQADKERQQLINAVKTYDPSWSTGMATARIAARKELTEPNGTTGQQILAVNRLAQHLDGLDKAIDQLPNLHGYDSDAPLAQKGPPGVTHLENWIGKVGALGSGGQDAQAYRRFNQYKDAVAKETQRVWSTASGGANEELQARLEEFNNANTPEELHASVNALVGLVHGQIDPLQNKMDQTLGPHSKDILSPYARNVYDKLAAKANPNGALKITVHSNDAQLPQPPQEPTADTQHNAVDQKTGAQLYIDKASGRVWMKQQ